MSTETKGCETPQYKVPDFLDNKLALGCAVQNIGTKKKLFDEKDSLPLNIKVGISYAIKDNWRATLDVNAPADHTVFAGVGTEYDYKLNKKIGFLTRAGYNTQNSKLAGIMALRPVLALSIGATALIMLLFRMVT